METFSPQPGDILSQLLVTDTLAFEVVAVTPHTIRVRPMKGGETVRSENPGGGYPVVWTEAIPDPRAETRVLRRRQDGTFRTARWAHPLYPCAMIDGKPVTRIDYRY